MFRRCLITLVGFLGFSAGVYGVEFRGAEYDVYIGDVNGDGIDDIYLKVPDTFVLLHGDVAVPLLIDSEEPSYLIASYSGEMQRYLDPIIDETIDVNSLQLTTEVASLGDINGDQVDDVVFVSSSLFYNISIDGDISSTHQIFEEPPTQALPVAVDPADDVLTDPEFYGFLTGNFSVSSTGAATYNIPIRVAPGINGVQPNLSLNYNSKSGNGYLGWGWSLSGMSQIHRCAASVVRDGYVSGVMDGDDYQLCIDGQRLVEVAAGEYRTERESYRKIVRDVLTGGFVVHNRDGSTAVYGSTDASTRRSADGNTYLDWHLSQIVDLAGNYMTYHYEKDASIGLHRIQRIEYTKNDLAADINQSVEFKYEDRKDFISGYTSGVYYLVDQRLSSVEVLSNSNLVRKYVLKYERHGTITNADPAKLSRLEAVSECFNDQETICSEPVEFEWTSRSQDVFSFDSDMLFENNSDPIPYLLGDVDGDGADEIVYRENNNVYMVEKFESISASNRRLVLEGGFNISNLVDVDSDGLDDLILTRDISGQYDSYKIFEEYIAFSDGERFLPPVLVDQIYNRNVSDGKTKMFSDMNGDGFLERIFFSQIPGSGNSGASGLSVLDKDPDGFVYSSFEGDLSYFHYLKPADMNGDGLLDFVSCGGSDDGCAFDVLLNSGKNTFADSNIWQSSNIELVAWAPRWISSSIPSMPFPVERESFMKLVDINGDRLTDVVWATENDVRVKVNNGAGFGEWVVWFNEDVTPEPRQYSTFKLADLNADGLVDIIYRDSEDRIAIAYNKGAIKDGGGVSDPIITGLDSMGNGFYDVNDDGVLDLSFFGLTGYSYHCPVCEIRSRPEVAVNTLDKNLIKRIVVNADVITHIEYGSSSDFAVHNESGTVSNYGNPESSLSEEVSQSSEKSRLKNVNILVKSVTTNDGVGGEVLTNYEYRGYGRHLSGWGSLGFRSVTEEREILTTGERFRTESHYLQEVTDEYALAGVLERQLTYASDDAGSLNLISDVRNQWHVQTLTDETNTDGFVSPHFIVNRVASHTLSYDLNGTPMGESSSYNLPYDATSPAQCETSVPESLVMSASAHTGFDEWGNPHQVVNVTCDGSEIFTTSLQTVYENRTGNGDWLLGLVTNSQVTKSALDASGSIQTSTRESARTYNEQGFVETIVREPNNWQFTHTTSLLDYDNYGSPTDINESWNDIAGLGFSWRGSTVSIHYEATGDRTLTTQNALGHQEVSVVDGRYGQIKSFTDKNELITSASFDDLGRIKMITGPDGNTVVTRYLVCDTCDSQSGYARFYSHTKATGASPTQTYFDSFGREVGQHYIGLNGESIHTVVSYNPAGRIEASSLPFFESDDIHEATYKYDSLGRVVESQAPNEGVTTTTYNGFEITTTNALLQTQVTWLNGLGNPVLARDNNGTGIQYFYDAFGNLTQTNLVSDISINAPFENLDQNILTGTITLMEYDLLGRQTLMEDPATGVTNYVYNGLDLLTSSTDAKSQRTEHVYDALGREIQRIDDASSANSAVRTHHWIYDTNDSGLGRLDRVSGFDTDGNPFSEHYHYNNIGLPTATTTIINGQNYESEMFYDDFNRPVGIQYPTGYRVINHYNSFGYRDRVSNGSSQTLWTASVIDALGNITESSHGNGVVTTREYDPRTGLVSSIRAMGNNNNLVVQNQRFGFDDLGNLKSRDDLRINYAQAFCYDNLNRLKAVRENTCNESDTDITYDRLGNILSRAAHGATANQYIYDPNNPYKLVNTINGGSYSYDANGNITGGDGRTITYTSFDKPNFMSKNGNHTQVTYGPNQNRIKRQDNDNVITYYVGGIYEKRVEGGSTSHVHYVGDIAIYIQEELDGVLYNDFSRYLHHDHIGSVVAKSDANATQVNDVEWLANDPWGLRQEEDWRGVILGTGYSSSDTSIGFTGHEHLDGVGLIHMNGRVYDPNIGRFLSADPFVQAPHNTQSFNRYAYVWNNPLSNTDPTGYQIVQDVDTFNLEEVLVTGRQVRMDLSFYYYDFISGQVYSVMSQHLNNLDLVMLFGGGFQVPTLEGTGESNGGSKTEGGHKGADSETDKRTDKEVAYDDYKQLYNEYLKFVMDNPGNPLTMTKKNLDTIIKRQYYFTLEIGAHQPPLWSFRGEWFINYDLRGIYDIADTFFWGTPLAGIDVSYNGKIHKSSDINYLGIGMLAAHFNQRGWIPYFTGMHNYSQWRRGEGDHNLSQICCQTTGWATYGSFRYETFND